MSYIIEVRQTETHAHWFARLRDPAARARIDIRIRRLSLGNPGDVKTVGGGVSELRVDYGPGNRVYFRRQSPVIVVLLCGGDKSSQGRDIAEARRLARQMKE